VLSCVCGLRRAICVELRVELTLTPILGSPALDQLHRQVDCVANGRIQTSTDEIGALVPAPLVDHSFERRVSEDAESLRGEVDQVGWQDAPRCEPAMKQHGERLTRKPDLERRQIVVESR